MLCLQEPVLFLKPTSSFLHAGPTAGPIEVPEPLESLHHEVELAVVISRRARDVPEASAMDFVGGNQEPHLGDPCICNSLPYPDYLPFLRTMFHSTIDPRKLPDRE